jgi:hypothetical protein
MTTAPQACKAKIHRTVTLHRPNLGYVARMKALAVLGLLVGMHCAVGAAEQILFTADFASGTAAAENVSLFSKKTDYRVVSEGTNVFLHAQAVDACSAYTFKLDVPPEPHLKLRWRWRIPAISPQGDERDPDRFDHAARVLVIFGSFLPTSRSLNYVWANVEPVGEWLEHPKSSHAQLCLVESGNARAGQWVSEERDLTADWARAFPGREMPHLNGIGLMTDSDSLGGTLTGDYADVQLVAE